MTPAKLATPATLAKRAQAFADGTSTSHWPHAFVASGVSEHAKAQQQDAKAASPEVRALVGLDRHNGSSHSRRAPPQCCIQ